MSCVLLKKIIQCFHFHFVGFYEYAAKYDEYFLDAPQNCELYAWFNEGVGCTTKDGNVYCNYTCKTETTVITYDLYLYGNTVFLGTTAGKPTLWVA